jgi:hypothetical protein
MECGVTRKRVLIIGVGQLGGLVLDALVREAPENDYLVASRNVETSIRRMNTALLAASQLGRHASIQATKVDLRNVDQSAALISEFNPDIIFNAACMQSWWVISELPEVDFRKLDEAQVGPWLPLHLTLVRDLMAAIAEARISPVVVNASFPDVVNHVLGKIGRSPAIGIGNVANNAPALQRIIASERGVPIDSVRVKLVMHHYLSHRISREGNTGTAPCYIGAEVNGQAISEELDQPKLLLELATTYRRVGGRHGQIVTAASAVSVLLPLIQGYSADVHAPGVHGLPGGYPVSISAAGQLDLNLPADMSINKAIAINEAAHPFEGIAQVRDDGSVRFSEEAMQILEDTLGYGHTIMALDQSHLYADELRLRYLEFANRRLGRSMEPATAG